MNKVEFLDVDQFYTEENLKKYGLSDTVIKEIQFLILKEKNKIKEIDNKIKIVLNENNKEIFNETLVKNFYIRNYRKFKFNIKSMSKNSFELKYKSNKNYIMLEDIHKEFINILIHPNYVNTTQIKSEDYSNVNVMVKFNKYFFDFIKANELVEIIDFFQLQKIKSYRIYGKFHSSLYFKFKKEQITEVEFNNIKNNSMGEIEFIQFYKYIIKMMKFLVYNFAFENFKYFKIHYFFQYESCYVTWLFFEYAFGELVTSILYAFIVKKLNYEQIIGSYTMCLHKNIKLDDQYMQ